MRRPGRHRRRRPLDSARIFRRGADVALCATNGKALRLAAAEVSAFACVHGASALAHGPAPSRQSPGLRDDDRTVSRGALSFWLILEPPIQNPLLLYVFGVYRQHAPALYTVAVVLDLFQCARTLVQVVNMRVARSD